MNETDLVMEMIDFIEDNLQEALTLEDIAEAMNYSKFHLGRLFSHRTGCTLYKYIQMRRLTEAARKLAETDRPIAEIAYEAGYQTQQSFTFAFKQVYHDTPRIYRKKGIFAPRKRRFMRQDGLPGPRVVPQNTECRRMAA